MFYNQGEALYYTLSLFLVQSVHYVINGVPMQVYKKSFQEKLLAVFENIKFSKWPLFVNYRPTSFAITGAETREIMKLVKPGDILVRVTNHYLSNRFMPSTFTDLGFYLGVVTEQHLKQLGKIEHPTEFNTGQQMVIHAHGDKVLLEDLIDFCRCDGLAVMRFPAQLKSLEHREIPTILEAYFTDPTKPAPSADTNEEVEEAETAKKKPKKKTKKEVDESPPEPVKLDATTLAIIKAEQDIAQHLAQGKVIEFEKVFKFFYRNALMQLSYPCHYDFGMTPFYSTRCAELVHFITKSICWNYGIEPQSYRVFFQKRQVIMPDLFVDGDLEEVWKMVN